MSGNCCQTIKALQRFCKQWPHGGGIGFVFSPNDPFAGIDLDHCRDLETCVIAPWAQQIITRCGSYSEISPSGTGAKIFGRGKLPGSGVKRHYLELYDCGRFFTVTGQHLPDTPMTIQDCQTVLHHLYAVCAVLDKALQRDMETAS